MMNDPYTHKPEHIVQVFNDIDSGKYPNVSFSHANVAMISKDVYYQMCYELEELRKASSMALKSLEEAAESIAALRWALYEEDENDCSTTD
jgi:hypothetical protein